MARRRKAGSIVAVAVLAGLVGYLLGPPMASAHKQRTGHKGSATEVHHGKGGKAANVEFGSLQVFAAGGFVDGSTFTGVMASGSGDEEGVCTGDAGGIISAVTATGPSGALIKLTADTDFDDDDGDTLWQAELASTVQGDFGANYIGFGEELDVTATETVDWIIYGFCFSDFSFGETSERLDQMRRALADR